MTARPFVAALERPGCNVSPRPLPCLRTKVDRTWSHRLIVHLRILKDLYLLFCPSSEGVVHLARRSTFPKAGNFCVTILGHLRPRED